MATPRYSPFEQILNKQREAAQTAENSSRLAHSFGTFKTTGWGEFVFANAIVFDAPYLYRPSVSYGASLETQTDSANLRATRYPRCSHIVDRWDIDAKGFYRGCWVAVTVEDRSPFIAPTIPDADPNYNIIHDFTFLGIATKDLPAHISGDLEEV